MYYDENHLTEIANVLDITLPHWDIRALTLGTMPKKGRVVIYGHEDCCDTNIRELDLVDRVSDMIAGYDCANGGNPDILSVIERSLKECLLFVEAAKVGPIFRTHPLKPD